MTRIFTFLMLLTCKFAVSQCTPNQFYSSSPFGLYPDTIINLPVCYGNNVNGYSTSLTLNTLSDTTVSLTLAGNPTDVILYLSAFRLNSVIGLPVGFVYIANQYPWPNAGTSPNYTPVQGCIEIIASQSAVQSVLSNNPSGTVFPITYVIDAKINSTNNTLANIIFADRWLSEVSGVPGIQPINYTGYDLVISNDSLVGVISNNGFTSQDNPASISFSLDPTGCSSFAFQWYMTPGVVSAPTGSSTIGWTLIPGATSNTYDPPTLFNSTSYACFVTPLSSCGSAGWAAGVASYAINSNSQCPELFISEYYEGSGNDKAIEIYNPTSNPINLSSYSIQRYANGAIDYSAGGSTNLVGTIQPFSTFVLVNGQTTSIANSPACNILLQALGDQLDGAYPAPAYFNGNDAIVLAKGGVIIDIFGKIGEDPGAAWTNEFPYSGTGTLITKEHSMIRKESVHTGVSVNPDFFDPLAQYDTLPINNWSNIGIHNCNCPQQSYTLGYIFNNGISNNNPSPITFTSNPTGCTSFTYQWYSTSGLVSAPIGSSTIGWSLIPGATSTTYDPPTLYSSTSFACFVTPNAGCGDQGWANGVASFTITYSPGSVNSEQVSFCSFVSVPLSFISQPEGFGNATFQWYFTNGANACPQGISTSGWTAIGGASSSVANYSPPSSGTYTLACLVTPEGILGLPAQWANGCKTVVVNNFTAQSIIGNPNITPFTPYTYLVSQTVGHTYTWTVYGGAVSTGQNTNQVSVIWAATGPYQVMLVENNGVCSDTSYLDVVSSSCALTVNVISIDPTTFCANGQARLIANAASGVSYQWKLNGSILPGATNDTLVATASGSYQAIAVLDASCSAISQPISLTELPTPTPPQIQVSGSTTNCNSQAPTLTAVGNYSSYLWNTGETTPTISVNTSGEFSVSAIDANGCTAQSLASTINLALLPPVFICVTTVDSLTGHNMIVWEKPATTLIDSFIVYKESVVADVYERIGSQPYAQLSTFLDVVSNPLVQSSRYKLGLVDTCGSESSLSSFHKTMHLTLNLGVGGTVNLIWDGYEGLNFGSYIIYRGTSPNNMTQLATIQSNLSSYTDLTPPTGAVYYQMEIVIAGCNPTAISYLRSRSNIANTGSIGFDLLTLDDVRVFPNPTDVGFTIQSNAIIAGESIELLDQVGRLVIQTNAAVNSTYVSTAHLAKGIYFLRLPNHPGCSRKLIVN